MRDSIQIQVEIDKKDIAFMVGLMESYDDFAVVRTVDQKRGLIELLCSPDYVPEVRRLLDSLKDEMSLRVLEHPAQ
jgi:hypothetical protein